jgi:hypothetical protein
LRIKLAQKDAVRGQTGRLGRVRFQARAAGRPCEGSRWSAGRRRAPEAGGSRKRIVLWRAPRPKRERVATSVRVAWPTTLAPLGAPLPFCSGRFVKGFWQSSGAYAPRERKTFHLSPPRGERSSERSERG